MACLIVPKDKNTPEVPFSRTPPGCWRYWELLELDSGKLVFGYIKSIFPASACKNHTISIVCF